MKITVIGSGYVGLVTAACFADMGNPTICVERDERRVAQLTNGHIDVAEPGLDVLVRESLQSGILRFSNDLGRSLESSEVCIIAVGNIAEISGGEDTSLIVELASEVAAALEHDSVIVIKSTVAVGTADKVDEAVQAKLQSLGKSISVGVVSNPEFMQEGKGIQDYKNPDRIIVGTSSSRAKDKISELYQAFTLNREKMLYMKVRDAEMTKYAAAAMLASRVSMMNELSNLAELLGVDIENVRRGIGSDSRVGYSYIFPGCGYGGSSFPKNVRSLITTAETFDYEPTLLKAVDARNNAQKQFLFEKVCNCLTIEDEHASVEGKTIAVWGLAYKPEVSGIQESAAIILIENLLKAGARVCAYDPTCNELAAGYFGPEPIENGTLSFAAHQYEALVDADALVLVTEWKPFREPDFVAMQKLLKQPVIIDGRNQYNPEELEAQGFRYAGIGRGRTCK